LDSGRTDPLCQPLAVPTKRVKAKLKDPPGLNVKNGNPWQIIGSWSMALPEQDLREASSDRISFEPLERKKIEFGNSRFILLAFLAIMNIWLGNLDQSDRREFALSVQGHLSL
jgi:hypothetical protein